jgi:hypothetical protein
MAPSFSLGAIITIRAFDFLSAFIRGHLRPIPQM